MDERALKQGPGLVFLSGSGGDTSMAGSGADGSYAEAGQMPVGQAGTGGDDGAGGSDNAGGTLGSAGGGDTAGASGGGLGGTSGAAGVGGAAAGGAIGGAPSAGSSGAGGAGGHLTGGRCPDLDDNFVADCEETIAKNASFDADASDWEADTKLVVSWVSLDASAHSNSGSLGVEDTYMTDDDGMIMLGAHQCIPVEAETAYQFAVQISVPDGAPNTTAGFQLLVYGDDDCPGDAVDVASSSFVSGSNWKVVRLSHTMPKLAKSLALRLVSIKPYREVPSNVLFDNVLVHPE